MSAREFRAGYYRILLEADDDDWMTLVVPLDAEARVDRGKSGPHLFKARWAGGDFYGELMTDEQPRFQWGADAPDSVTDLLDVAIAEWAKVTIWQEDTRESAAFVFRVRTLERL